MVPLPRFLTSSEVSAKLVEFKDAWYAIAKQCEVLSEHKSGLEAAFETSLNGIYNSIKKCDKHLKEIEPSLKHLLPSKKEEIEALASGVLAALGEFGTTIEQQLEDVRAFKRMSKDLKGLVERLESMEEEFREAESKTSEICTRYFERKKDYNQAKERITGAMRGKLEGIKGRFFQKVEPIVHGYNLTLTGRPIDIDALFIRLFEKPLDVEAVELLPKESSKGLLDAFTGKKEMNKTAKEAVLKYMAQEILAEAKPTKDQEAMEIHRLDAHYADLRALEAGCREAEKKREELSKPRNEIMAEISRLKKSDAFFLGEYDGILELRKKYLGIFNNTNEKVKALLSGSEELLAGYTEIEPDIEKRELRGQIKQLKSVIVDMERERLRVEGLLKEERERNKGSEETIAMYREKLKGMRAHIQRLEEEIDAILRG